jgi:5-methylcytosine-specific restriction protein A
MGNLRSLCSWHHRQKSSREGAAAAHARRRAIEQRFRRDEAHPGLM